ncbi:MAG: thiamine pyrophosphate-dependent enzyme, partial [Salegentibacter sp.]
QTLKLLLEFLQPNKHAEWHQRFKDMYKIEYDKVIKGNLDKEKAELGMAEVIEKINEYSKGDAVIVSDVGQHQMKTCRYAKFNSTRSNVTSGGLGTMGFALPAAIGAKMGSPKRDVVAIIGDGGYQMTIQELGTIFQTRVPVKIVVLNNGFLGMVRQWQQMFFDKRYASTEMVNPDFVTIAKGYHLKTKRVTERAELESAVREMMESEEAFFLEVKVEQEENVFPMIPTGASVSEILLE